MTEACGPRGREALALVPALRKDPLALLISLKARYGDRVVIPFLGRHEVFLLSAPDDVAHVLVSKQNSYVKSPSYKPLMELLGNGLLTSEGEVWARQRRIVQPMFARRHIVEFGPLMVDAAAGMLDRWAAHPAGGVVDVAQEMSALTLDVVGRALFGADLTGEAAEMAPALRAVMDAYTKLVNNPMFWLVPSYQKWRTPNRRRAEWAEVYLRGVVERLVARRLAEARRDGSRDLLDMLLAARSSGAGMSEQQVRDELMTFMLAGHETTATALAWTFLLLSTHPAARARLEGEVDAVLAGRPPTVEDADKLEWTAAVVSESMRLYPPAWIIERAAIADDEIDDLRIPRGSIVITPPYLMHRSSVHWPNPEGFDPARFLPGAAAGRHRFAYLPFGGGKRQCVGGGFAMLEATLLLAAITQRHRLDLVPGPRPVPQPTVTLRPRDGIPMTLHPR